jgi:hypothetical protein
LSPNLFYWLQLHYKTVFHKFVLLNIPEQKVVVTSGIERDQTKGKLNLGGLDYAAGFSIENDGEQQTSLFNENTKSLVMVTVVLPTEG